MTAEEVLVRIAGLVAAGKLKFTLDEEGFIRDSEGRCPLCSLAHALDPDFDWRESIKPAADLLGMFYRHASEIADGADLPECEEWRAKVLLACGVEERTPKGDNT